MWSSTRQIAAGDLVIVWMTRDNIQPLVVSPGKDFNSKYGNYRQADFVGVPYGSKVGSRTGKGFVYLLRPTPELWTLALPHRTQILYLADIAFITSRLNIRRGSRVIEAGTGSGSFTHSVARTIGDSGHLWSYEFHEVRANKARCEFTRHGMTNIVTLTHRNVCKEGFTVDNTADSVFLDLPAPWDAVEHAKRALRKDRITRICCFSPCMEQVLRTVAALNDTGFTEIAMYETLLRPHEVAQVPQLASIGDISGKLKEAEKRREEKRLRQIANNKARSSAAAGAETPAITSTKRKRDDEDDTELVDETITQDLTPGDTSPDTKRVKTAEGDEGVEAEGGAITASVELDMINAEGIEGGLVTDESRTDFTIPSSNLIPNSRISVSNALPEVRGHTSYLTFAVLVPFSVPVDSSGTKPEDSSGQPTLAPTAGASSATSSSEAENKSSIVVP
ncbi:GCD14-domain-containing protein [Macrolepiota fuliginosa MF-IS2]|uniref:tRNA (adenine(58)-N(1))-methyltransferase catalytic subunit TRM61 n=1 Tax=Macrolepiota fuliginosa MF-IS2 TaxID=1400762 RepID=A0A9P5XEL5_9AGAR|nr:GCD14-domain-containing protein [Macrolepiota fuliginosa MF-IS2]